MTSARQIEANRRNALKSTGPKTEDGKNRSRANAVKHGLAGQGTALPELDAEKLHLRLDAWRPLYLLKSVEDEWLFEQMIISTVQIEASQAAQFKLRANLTARAMGTWDEDRADEAAQLGRKIGRKPELVYHELLRSKHGGQWLLAQWHGLAQVLKSNREWTSEHTQRAFDLQGVPLLFRDGMPHDDDETLADLIAREIESLETLLEDSLEPLDAMRRAMAAEGYDPEPNPELARLQRYEAAALRRFHHVRGLLTANPNPSPVAPPKPTPLPAPQPAPEPEPEVEPETEVEVEVEVGDEAERSTLPLPASSEAPRLTRRARKALQARQRRQARHEREQG